MHDPTALQDVGAEWVPECAPLSAPKRFSAEAATEFQIRAGPMSILGSHVRNPNMVIRPALPPRGCMCTTTVIHSYTTHKPTRAPLPNLPPHRYRYGTLRKGGPVTSTGVEACQVKSGASGTPESKNHRVCTRPRSRSVHISVRPPAPGGFPGAGPNTPRRAPTQTTRDDSGPGGDPSPYNTMACPGPRTDPGPTYTRLQYTIILLR